MNMKSEVRASVIVRITVFRDVTSYRTCRPEGCVEILEFLYPMLQSHKLRNTRRIFEKHQQLILNVAERIIVASLSLFSRKSTNVARNSVFIMAVN